MKSLTFKKNSCKGTILLESLVTIPLLLLLIGTTIFIGEAMLAKHNLILADRYVAWNLGNRHRPNLDIKTIENEVETRFFKNQNLSHVNITTKKPDHPTNYWGMLANGAVELTTYKTSPWIIGILRAGSINNYEKKHEFTKIQNLRGRDHNFDSSLYIGHIVLTRSGQWVFLKPGVVNDFFSYESYLDFQTMELGRDFLWPWGAK